MFRFAPYVLKSLWRHRVRSGLTASGAAVAMFVLCFVGAVEQGLDGLARDARARRTLVVFQENRLCPMSSRLPEDYARQIAAIDGVEQVVPIQVYTNNCRVSLDAVVFYGLPPEQLRSVRDLRLVEGEWDQFENNRDAALVGRTVARRRNLRAGQTFSIGPISVRVAGIFQSAASAEDNQIFTHLEFLRRTRGVNLVGLVTELVLAGDASPERVAKAIDAKLHAGPVATVTRTKGAFQANSLADLVDLIGFTNWLG